MVHSESILLPTTFFGHFLTQSVTEAKRQTLVLSFFKATTSKSFWTLNAKGNVTELTDRRLECEREFQVEQHQTTFSNQL